jgi:hypothetical protein
MLNIGLSESINDLTREFSRSSWRFVCSTMRPMRLMSAASRPISSRCTVKEFTPDKRLIARRLLERGVRYVQLWHGAGQPWDNHAGIEAAHRNLAGQIDQPIAALMTDLKQRGLFEDTLILWGGEFGRTPTVELSGDGKPQSGRDHNHWGFSVWLAGGGIKGGTVYGATDDIGFQGCR